MKLLGGIVTAMLTPFTAQGALDLAALERLTDFLIDKGVDCLYPTGSMGEMLRLSLAEREQVAQTVVERAAGRVPVYIHTGAITTAETVRLTQHAQAIGADGVGVVTPAYFALSEPEMEAFFSDVAGSTDLPVYLYAIPQLAANDISADLAARLGAKHPNIVGIKCSTPGQSSLLSYLAIDDFQVLQGQDRLTLGSLAMGGVAGIVSGGSSAFPEPFVAVKRALDRGDIAAARSANQVLQAYARASNNGSVAMEKAILKLRGLDIGGPRRPALPPSEEQIAALAPVVEELEARCAAL